MLFSNIQRGQIYYADLEPSRGSEQGGIRPVLVIQNDIGNRYSPTLIVVAITGRVHTKATLPTHHFISGEAGLKVDSIILLEQIRTIDKVRLLSYIGSVSNDQLMIIDEKIKISLGLQQAVYYL